METASYMEVKENEQGNSFGNWSLAANKCCLNDIKIPIYELRLRPIMKGNYLVEQIFKTQ